MKWRLWLRPGERGKGTSPGENFLIPLSCPPRLFSYAIGCCREQKNPCVCVPLNPAVWRQVHHEVCALQVGKSIKTPKQSVPDPLSGCAQEFTPVPPFLFVQTRGAGGSQSSRHPFRQKYLLQCWVCARLNLFKEFAITN